MSDGATASGEQPFVSLYRRFRPGRFDELRGQDHVALALQGAVRDDRVSHAYLFSGPRGTGKTSTARILAKALNCAAPVDGEPCGVCSSCVEIVRGNSLDVHELDAASNNGVDAMRDLVSHSALGTPGRWKVYIVDEVHMLSNAAANALLKTLEEPPSHVVFVLATTDPQKVPPTIRSRTQHFEFRLLGADTLQDLLAHVSAEAGLGLDDEALAVAVRRGRGSARDALSALDQVVAIGSADEARPELDELAEAICEEDGGSVLVAVAALGQAGWGPQQLAAELVDDLRQGFLLSLAPNLASVSGSELDRLSFLATRLGLPRLVRTIETLGRAQVDMREAPDARVVLEMALVRAARPELDDSPSALSDRLARVERALAGGNGPVTASSVVAQAQAAAQVAADEVKPRATSEDQDPAVRPTLGALRRQRASTPDSPATSKETGPTPPIEAAEKPQPPPVPEPEPAVAARGHLPDRDELVQAWGDTILRSLPVRAKALYSAGRFSAVEDGTALFALPNAAHRDRCEEVRSMVEEKLAEFFAIAVPVRLVVDGDESSSTVRSGGGRQPASAAATVVEDEDFDPNDEVVDVAVESVVEARLLQAFPGAEEVSG
jgi:DNA polymerase III subunit gamma/tau